MKRCTVIIPDAGPFNSLWVADRLDLLLALDMRLVVVDAIYDELTSDTSYPKDKDVKAFIDGHQPPFVIENSGHFRGSGSHARGRKTKDAASRPERALRS